MADQENKNDKPKKEILFMSLRDLKKGLKLDTGKDYEIIIKPERIYISY